MLNSMHVYRFFDMNIHQWNGFYCFSQSELWHWCMTSLHMQWYLCTNNSGLYFCFCSPVGASSPQRVLSFIYGMNFIELHQDCFELFWEVLNVLELMMHVIFSEWDLNWNGELGNKLLKSEYGSELSSSGPRTFQGRTMWHTPYRNISK